jgi:tetratricopeptide (TPR) repeat protein
MYVRGRLTQEKRRGVFIACYSICLMSAVLAMKTKEIAFTLPLILILYECIFFKGKIKRRIFLLIPVFLTMFIIPFTMIDIDKPLEILASDIHEATRLQTGMPRMDYVFTEIRVIITYIKLIFLPINLNIDYDYPLFNSLINAEVFLSFLFLLTLFSVGVFLLYRYLHSGTPAILIPFGILWFFITLLIESGMIPIVDVIFEHRMYLPSIGLFLVINTVLFFSINKIRGIWHNLDIVGVVTICMIVGMLVMATYSRNEVWNDEITLWEDVVKKSPKKARAHNNLGFAYYSRGLIDKAKKEYYVAITLDPMYSMAHNNLGLAYKVQNIIDKAIEHYRIAIELNPSYAMAYDNLGLAYYTLGYIDKAMEQYRIAIDLEPSYSMAYNNLGFAYYSQGLTDRAVEQYLLSIQLNPDIPETYNNLGVAYKSQGLIHKAIEQYRIAIKLNPNIPELHNNLGNAYKANGLRDMAIKHYKESIRLKPDWRIPHFNLGSIYFEKGDRENASREFEKAQ